jgi:hypothetical protein
MMMRLFSPLKFWLIKRLTGMDNFQLDILLHSAALLSQEKLGYDVPSKVVLHKAYLVKDVMAAAFPNCFQHYYVNTPFKKGQTNADPTAPSSRAAVLQA